MTLRSSMAATGKRKANDANSNGLYQNDRLILKRRDTSISGFQNLNLHGHQHKQQEQHEATTDSAISLQHNDTKTKFSSQQHYTSHLPSPPNSATTSQDEFMNDNNHTCNNDHHINNPPHHLLLTFQSHLATFCQTHGSIFGPGYLHTLQTSHLTATTSLEPAIILSAGQNFTHALNRYVAELQSAAIRQVQLRGDLVRVGGIDSVALEALDAVLARLDERIVVVGAEAQGLEFELGLVEGEVEGGGGGGGGR